MNLLDEKGEEILDSISQAKRFNNWMFKEVERYAHGKILEIGSGIGNISEFFISKNYDITLSDLRPQYLDILSKKFPNTPNLKINLVDQNFQAKYKNHLNKYDFIFCLNVIEHIENDRQAVKNLNALLKKEGKMMILVPAFNILFNDIDVTLGHFRRYNKKKLNAIIPKQMKILKTWYFNFVGLFGWFIVGSILKRKTIKKSNMKVYNFLMPIIKIFDKITLRMIGLSVINLSKK